MSRCHRDRGAIVREPRRGVGALWPRSRVDPVSVADELLLLGRALRCPRCAVVPICSRWKEIALFWKVLSVPGASCDPVLSDLSIRLA
jgi:hypothetical protein